MWLNSPATMKNMARCCSFFCLLIEACSQVIANLALDCRWIYTAATNTAVSSLGRWKDLHTSSRNGNSGYQCLNNKGVSVPAVNVYTHSPLLVLALLLLLL